MQERVEAICVDRCHRLLRAQQVLTDGVDREADRRLGRPLRVPGLEHVELPLLDRELGVLHVLVMGFEPAQDLHQSLVDLRHHVLQLADVTGRAHSGDDVLALGVDEKVATGLRRTSDLVPAEGHAGGRCVALVAEHHLLDVDRGAPVIGDAIDAPVLNGTVAAPGVKYGANRLSQLGLGVLRKLVELLETLDQFLERLDRQFGVGIRIVLLALILDQSLEVLPGDPVHDVAEHLDQAPVGVPGKALVLGHLGQAEHGLVVQTQVEDRVEHSRHRLAGTAADRDEERIRVVAEMLARLLLEPSQRVRHLLLHPVRLLTGAHVLHAGLGA